MSTEIQTEIQNHQNSQTPQNPQPLRPLNGFVVAPAPSATPSEPCAAAITTVLDNRIEISGLSPTTYKRLDGSALLDTCLAIKKYFQYGEAGGRRVAKHKQRIGEPLANPNVRFSVAYTTQFAQRDDGSGTILIISLWPNYAQGANYLIDAGGNRRPMSEREMAFHLAQFVTMLADNLTKVLDDITQRARLCNETSDYFISSEELYPDLGDQSAPDDQSAQGGQATIPTT